MWHLHFSVQATLRTTFRHSHQESCTHHGRTGRDRLYPLHYHASNNGQVPEYRQDLERAISSLRRDLS
ncbi:hypothetical protein KVT40_008682 [Elsinoe batatas]|uniref:Uncharacterized protein n=1 Tax=Elsinoe batatas TaxID=2601811 RepID=A0A8K0KXD3_9PEZI|nr:hypothetical protein KVT40_008682 [Elsinoe batatas]